MKAVRLHEFGSTGDGLRIDELPRSEPGEGDLVLEMVASPINPADINIVEGKYGELPELPAIIGNEGVGKVRAMGSGVTGFSVGDVVVPLGRSNWAEEIVIASNAVIRVPREIDALQAAMLSVNPPSAWAMLEDFVRLEPGDWLVQNAANSAVGRCVIQLAKVRGYRTLNVVRRAELVDELMELGADVVVLEGEDLREVVPRVCGENRPRLALNAVGGASALNLANGLADGSTVVTYGAMGRLPLKLPNGLLIFRGLRFEGFWLRRLMGSPVRMKSILQDVAALVVAGKLRMPVHRVFPLSDVRAALAEAAGEGRSGKVMLKLTQGDW